ncbi:MAG: dUTP diphosphatase [Desulfovibrionaceae bacterium]
MQELVQDIKCVYLRDARALYGENGLSCASVGAAGMDLRSCLEGVVVNPFQRVLIPSGISLAIPSCLVGAVYSRSGLGAKYGIVVTQGVGLIDSDYRGEITIPIYNLSSEAYTIEKGERIAQIVFHPFVQSTIVVVDMLCETERGEGGFGHTGLL